MKNNKIMKIILAAIYAISQSMLSFQLLVKKDEIIFIIITVLVSLIVGFVFFYKTFNYVKDSYKSNKFAVFIFIILSVIIYSHFMDAQMYYVRPKIIEYYNIDIYKYFLISILCFIYLGIFIGYKVKDYTKFFYKNLDSWDKKVYVITSLISIVIILILYNISDIWYMQMDRVYSLDSKWVLQKIYASPLYYDVRHPFLQVFAYPLYSIINVVARIIIKGKINYIVTVIFLQIINVQFLILSALMIKKMANNKMVYILYMISMPTLLFSVFFEKYQICVFLLVCYVYMFIENKKERQEVLILGAGAMPTTAFIGISEIFGDKKIVNKIKNILLIAIKSVVLFITFGLAHLLKYGYEEITATTDNFGKVGYTLTQKLAAVLKMIEGSFIALKSKIVDAASAGYLSQRGKEAFIWDNVTSNISKISIIIFAIILLGILVKRKEVFTKIATSWLVFSFILFIGIGWSITESPLFSIYFSWAIIPLFVYGLDFIIDTLKLNKNVLYAIMFLTFFIINSTMIFSIIKFLL